MKKVFSTHHMDAVKYLSVDLEKEVQILTKRFKELNFKQEQVNQLIQKYKRPDLQEVKEIPKRTCKISIPRWFSKKMAEYDMDKDMWQACSIKGLELPVYPMSSICYSLDMNQFFVLGGFNNQVDHKSAFSSRCLKIMEEQINPFESIYTSTLLSPMKQHRGCFPSAILITKRIKQQSKAPDLYSDVQLKVPQPNVFEGFIFVIGGKVREDKLTRYCERYDLTTNTWS